MKTFVDLWKNEWFKLGTTVVIFTTTAISGGWGASLIFFYVVAWMLNKKLSQVI